MGLATHLPTSDAEKAKRQHLHSSNSPASLILDGTSTVGRPIRTTLKQTRTSGVEACSGLTKWSRSLHSRMWVRHCLTSPGSGREDEPARLHATTRLAWTQVFIFLEGIFE